MTEQSKHPADLDGNGVIDEREHEIYIEQLRREMEDSDAKRDAQRRITYFAASGILLFPFSVVVTEFVGLTGASAHLSDMSSIYYGSISVVVASYFGFSNLGGKK